MLGTDLGVAQATTCFTFPHLDPQPDLFCLKSTILELSVTSTQPSAFWGVVTFDTVPAPKPVTSGPARAPISPLTQPISYAAGLSYKSVPSPCTLLHTWLGLRDALFLGYIILFWFWENIWFFEKYSWRLYSFLCLTFYCSKWSSKIMKTILIKKINLDTCYTCGPLMVFSSVWELQCILCHMCFGREPGIKGYLCSHRWHANFSM